MVELELVKKFLEVWMEKAEVFYSSGWAVCSRMPSMIRSISAIHVTALGHGESEMPWAN